MQFILHGKENQCLCGVCVCVCVCVCVWRGGLPRWIHEWIVWVEHGWIFTRFSLSCRWFSSPSCVLTQMFLLFSPVLPVLTDTQRPNQSPQPAQLSLKVDPIFWVSIADVFFSLCVPGVRLTLTWIWHYSDFIEKWSPGNLSENVTLNRNVLFLFEQMEAFIKNLLLENYDLGV